MRNVILFIRYWKILWTNRIELPIRSEIKDPILQYEAMSGGFYWEDEGLRKLHYPFTEVFKCVIRHRTKLILGPKSQIENYHSNKLNKRIFNLAKKYYPDWIGFEEYRSSYNPKVADRMIRILKVADWKMDKLMDEE